MASVDDGGTHDKVFQMTSLEEIGCGPLCRVNSLTDRGKRLQLFKIMCVTVIPILGVWGFTLYSLSDSVDAKNEINVAQTSMAVVVLLGKLIHRLQTERDMSVLYLTDLGPGTKTFLLKEYIETDDALQRLPIWPGGLKSNPREEFRSKANLMAYIAHHRNSMDPNEVDIYEEINFYTSITSEFLEWLIENIKGSGFGSIWKTLVAYQKITRCKEKFGIERAYGAMFFASGQFPKWVDFEFYNYQVHTFKYNVKTAVFYSDIVMPLLLQEERELQSEGINITALVDSFRHEIQNHDLNTSYTSGDKAKLYFEKMTEFMDSLLTIQNKIAAKVLDEVDLILVEILTKIVIYASLVAVVIGMCPVIMVSSESLASNIQHYTQIMLELTERLDTEKTTSDDLLYQMVPRSVVERLKENCRSEFFKSVTISFSSVHNFNGVMAQCAPADLSALINSLYVAMDEIVGHFDVCKIEMLNDCYMISSGVPTRNGEEHASEIAKMSIAIQRMMEEFPCPVAMNDPIQLQIGVNTGKVSAGVIGNAVLRYCLFGETVTIASRLNTHGAPRKIHISESTKKCLKKKHIFKMKYRGNIDMKELGHIDTYWLTGFNSRTMEWAPGARSHTSSVSKLDTPHKAGQSEPLK